MQQLRRKLTKLVRRVRGTIRRPTIDRIFMSAGGSGSSFVVHSLRGFGVRVAERPDVMLQPAELKDLAAPATLAARTMFSRRSGGFVMDGTRPIEANLIDYVRYVADRPNLTTLFCTVQHFHFFSRNKIRNVVFLVRNPVQAYASFAKPVRHQDLVEEWGGAFTEKSMRRYVEYWAGFVREYLALKRAGLEPGLLRYETLLDDAKAIGLDHFFPDWRRSKNRVDDPKAAQFIRTLVERDFLEIYPSWDV